MTKDVYSIFHIETKLVACRVVMEYIKKKRQKAFLLYIFNNDPASNKLNLYVENGIHILCHRSPPMKNTFYLVIVF